MEQNEKKVEKAFFLLFRVEKSRESGNTYEKSPFYRTDALIFFRCKQEMKVVFDLKKEVERRYIWVF